MQYFFDQPKEFSQIMKDMQRTGRGALGMTTRGAVGGLELVKSTIFKPFQIVKEGMVIPAGDFVSKKVSPWVGAPVQIGGELIPTTPFDALEWYGSIKAFKWIPKISKTMV